MSTKLFSVTKADLDVETFRCGGAGGQNVNKRDTGVRIRHRESGAVGEGREHRTQDQNKKAAFDRMVNSTTFQRWLKVKAAVVQEGFRNVEQKVDKLMADEHISVQEGPDASPCKGREAFCDQDLNSLSDQKRQLSKK